MNVMHKSYFSTFNKKRDILFKLYIMALLSCFYADFKNDCIFYAVIHKKKSLLK